MDRIALSMMIKGPLSLATLGAAIYLSGDLLLGVCGLAAAWLLLLLDYDARNGPSLLRVASRAKHPAVDFRSALARRLQLSWRPRALVTLTLLALPVGIVMALVSFNTNIPRYFIEHYLWNLGLGHLCRGGLPSGCWYDGGQRTGTVDGAETSTVLRRWRLPGVFLSNRQVAGAWADWRVCRAAHT